MDLLPNRTAGHRARCLTGDAPIGVLLVMPLIGLLWQFARERSGRIDQAIELSGAYRGTALLLGNVLEYDHNHTGSHSRDVVDLALAVGERMRLSPGQLRNLEFGALLHDVGKIAVPKEIINKPGPSMTSNGRSCAATPLKDSACSTRSAAYSPESG